MKKALGGTASVSLKDGAIKGINLAQSLRDIKASGASRFASLIANTSNSRN
jgi:AsmA protein